jgi:hypothetical protein
MSDYKYTKKSGEEESKYRYSSASGKLTSLVEVSDSSSSVSSDSEEMNFKGTPGDQSRKEKVSIKIEEMPS